jgi:predicted AlkP superfamily phosphohydrolase/phosphomutase
MPEDTKALDQGFLTDDDFLELSDIILEERLKMLDIELKRFKSGLLFVYFSTTDPVQHMFWRYVDKEHPLYEKKEARKYSMVIRKTYERMDGILGDVMKRLDDRTTLIILSDHGFGSFRRYFHLNTWLKKNGYITLADESLGFSNEFFENVDFRKTKAYALGFNALYLNLEGREGKGTVSPGEEKEWLIEELIEKLEDVRDPETGEKAINKVFRKEELYSGSYLEEAPDLIIGYRKGYRSSWETALGKIPEDLFGDNKKKWSGTHLWDYRLVPGIVLSNKKIKTKDPALYDIAPTILAEFGISKLNEMVGEVIF